MQTRTFAQRVFIWEAEPLVLVALITNAAGTPLTTLDVDSFGIAIFEMGHNEAQGDAVFEESPIDPDSAYFDTLQTDEFLSMLPGATGYNFKFTIDNDRFVFAGAKNYRVQITSSVFGGSQVQVYDVQVGEVL